MDSNTRPDDPWGPYRSTIEDDLATCADYLGRLQRSLAGEIAPDRHYFHDKVHQLQKRATPRVEPVPALRAGQTDERIGRQRGRQVALYLVNRPLDVDPGWRPPPARPLAIPLGRLVEHPTELPHPLERHRGVHGFRSCPAVISRSARTPCS